MENYILAALVFWWASGFTLWALAVIRARPRAWRTSRLTYGWDVVLCVYLPGSLILGPILWFAAAKKGCR